MGVDLCQYGNHNIKYSGRHIDEIVKDSDSINYYIDNFEDLKIENTMTIKEFQDYLWKSEEEAISKH